LFDSIEKKQGYHENAKFDEEEREAGGRGEEVGGDGGAKGVGRVNDLFRSGGKEGVEKEVERAKTKRVGGMLQQGQRQHTDAYYAEGSYGECVLEGSDGECVLAMVSVC
jgi:hypothetical protein